MKNLIGTGVALITPFTSDLEVDASALRSVVNFTIDNGIDYLVVLGTTGESVTLSKQEKKLVMDTVVEANAGRLPLVLGIGGNDTKAVIQEINNSDLSRFDAILSVSPMYNKPSQEGIYQHFAAISNASSKPIVLYNVPARTGSNMLPETVLRLAKDFSNIIAVKEAAGDLVQAMRILAHKPDDFLVISGDDMIALPMTLAGGAGVISVIGQGFPEAFSNMIKLGLDTNATEAYKLQNKLMPAIDYIFEEGNPAGIKIVLESLGLCGANVRLPLVETSKQLQEKIGRFVATF